MGFKGHTQNLIQGTLLHQQPLSSGEIIVSVVVPALNTAALFPAAF